MALDTVIFDFDDTLIDWSGCKATWPEMMGTHLDLVVDYLVGEGYELPEKTAVRKQYHETIMAAWDNARKTGIAVSVGSIFKQCLELWDVPIDSLAAVMDVYARAGGVGVVDGVVLYDETIPVLDYLKANGYKIGLVTNSMSTMKMRDVELREYGIIDYFDARVTSGDVGFIKPDPRIYNHIMGLLDTDKDHAIFVGDRPGSDILGANRVGMPSVWMKPAHINYDLNDAKPDYTINKLDQLLPILEDRS